MACHDPDHYISSYTGAIKVAIIFFITSDFYFETNIFIFTDGTPSINIYATFTPLEQCMPMVAF